MFKGMICFADRRVIPWLMAVFFFLGLIIPCNALSTTSAIPQVLSKKVTEPDTATRARLMESYGRLPLSFETNHGQTDGKVKFLSRGSGYNLFLTSTEAVLSLRKAKPPKARIKDKAGKEPALHKADKPEPATVVSMKLVGANADPKITGADQLPGKVNYFLGKDPKKWRTNIPTFARVRYTNVYPGIDLVFYGQGQKLEYDFIVAPGADPEAIALCFGQTRLKIDQNGDLALDTKGGELRLQKPFIYQDIDGIRKPVPGGYVLHPVKNKKQTHLVGFKIADYDRARPLVIDPVLVYSTYLGGSYYDYGQGIAVDATGSCYVTGYTLSTDFPTQDPLYPNNAGSNDVFITKLSPAGDALVYSTYLGGSGVDRGYGIAVDATGSCYVTGWVSSIDFPTRDPLYPNNAGSYDAFVTRLNPAGDAIVYSTYLGGRDDDHGYGIAVNATGSCYVTGYTNSTNFSTQDPLYPDNAGSSDAFVTRLNPAGDALIYSTYLGGSSGDHGYGIAVNATGSCYVTGYTNSTNFPTHDPLYPDNTGSTDVFVTSLSPAGDALIYSTYLGGSSGDEGYGIAVDATGNCYVTGYTHSTDFPTHDPLYPDNTGSTDVFVTSLSPAGDALIYSTYLGGSSDDYGYAIAVDATGNCYVTGSTWSTDFPTQDPLYLNLAGSSDAFACKISSVSPEPSIATYFSYPVGYPIKNVDRQYYNVPRVSGAYCDFLDPYYGDDDDDHLEETLHPGEDWNGGSGIQDYGDPVYAVADGEVIWAGDGGNGWGYIVLIKHTLPDGSFVYSQYAHLLEIIRDEGNVRRGEKIGTIGDGSVPGENYTTYSPHLHFEIRRSNMEGVSASYWPYGDGKDADWINSHYYNPSDVGGYTYPGPPPAEGFIEDHLSPYDRIVDNLDPEFSKGGGNWELYEDTYRNYYYISDANPGNCWAEWRPNLPVSGQYEVFVCFWAYPDQSTSVPYTVYYDGGQATINIDQLQTFDNSDFRWHQISLGTFNFQRGNSGYVRLSGAPNNTNVDTIWFKCVGTTDSCPTAQFTGDKTEGTKPLTVQFIDQSTGVIDSWYWAFGDSETSTEQNPTHTYNTPGAYTVSLTVTGPGGTDTETKTDYITVTADTATKDELAVDFKTTGIYVYNTGSWNRIYQGVDPEGLCSFGTYLAADFGTTYGLYVYDAGAWTRVHKGVAIEKMTGFGDKLAVDFGTSYPIYEYNFATDTWTPIYNYSSPRDTIEALGDKLVVDFKTAGIYVYDAGIWNRIYKGVDPVNIVSFGDKLAIDFGTAYGLYVYEYDTDNWTRVYKGVAIEKMAEIDGDLAIDFGTAYGLYVYEFDTDNWTKVYKGVAIEKMAGFDGKLAVDFGTSYPIYEYDFDTDNWNSIYQYSSPRDELVPANIFD